MVGGGDKASFLSPDKEPLDQGHVGPPVGTMASRDPLLFIAPLPEEERKFTIPTTLAEEHPQTFHLCPQNPIPLHLTHEDVIIFLNAYGSPVQG